MDGVGGDDSISVPRLCPLQRDRGISGGIDAGSWLSNWLCMGKYMYIIKCAQRVAITVFGHLSIKG